MTLKEATGVAKVLGVVFTSVVAPVLVHVAIRDLRDDSGDASHDDSAPAKRQEPAKRTAEASPAPSQASSLSHAAAEQIRPMPRPLEMKQLLSEGAGKTPEEGLEQALRLTLVKAVTTELDGTTWANRGRAAADFLMPEAHDLIRVVKQIGTRKEWRLRGSLYHVQVVLELNRSALLARLQTVLQGN